jgi:N-acetylglucosaminyldiphosphoundecaprenol N-acetyl-beta-D-mannosaminyltransferase
VRRSVSELQIKSPSAVKLEASENPGVKDYSVTVLGVPVDVYTKSELTASFLEILKSHKRGWISYVNVHTIDIANKLPWYRQFIVDALIRYCDGEGVRFGAYLLGEHIPERITLSYYINDLASAAVEHHLNIFLLGGTKAVAELAAKRLKDLYPAIKLTGYHHGYFSEQENSSVISMINAGRPDILLLGMGVPKQEEWAKNNFDKLNAKIIWMGGGFLDTLSGKIKRCPLWLSEIGFEWLFRFIHEPRRLWKRYLIGNPMFLLHILQARIHRR